MSAFTCPEAECLVSAGLQSRILLPADDEYATRINSYWCNSAKLRPACIVQPQSSAEVATAIKALGAAVQPFAIRAGGHGNSGGHGHAANNNVDGGVLVDLAHLATTEYDTATQMAHLGPAAQWKTVYEVLEKHGRVVAGAREAEVGVGGFLLGGGNTFRTGRYGFSCDSVVAYEVVLADGRIVTADATGPHADLFHVLKGGGNNFGVITRFTMATMQSGPLWGGYVVRPVDVFPAAADAIVDFTANQLPQDPDSTLNFTVAHMPRLGGSAVVTICTNVAAVEDPPAFAQFRQMPEVVNNIKVTSLQEVLPYASLPSAYYNIWYTLTFKNDASIILKANELHTQLAADVGAKVTDGDFTTHLSFQPLPKTLTQRSKTSNILGLDTYPYDAILIQVNASVRTSELATWAQPRVKAFIDQLGEFCSTVEGGLCPWLYMNYAHADQKVLQSYGPDNVRKLREAAAKYDPSEVFQRLCVGGFKISLVRG
ncbi:hypothetical protein KVR01_013582 [Diaporthe batatas]|uniref:uncharacterized protein n=1 Tax=Diaporthe batatas TaxID=748121 RepID=UPI001D04D509|nr:uncharacterized protein KVR01_013582 [Diaporthe batatas]KAG8156478.1 hypothetical protein KVR01_013582 [Diaporthe batatas]